MKRPSDQPTAVGLRLWCPCDLFSPPMVPSHAIAEQHFRDMIDLRINDGIRFMYTYRHTTTRLWETCQCLQSDSYPQWYPKSHSNYLDPRSKQTTSSTYKHKG